MDKLLALITLAGSRGAFAKSVGITPQYLSQILNSRALPSGRFLRNVSKVHGVVLDPASFPDVAPRKASA